MNVFDRLIFEDLSEKKLFDFRSQSDGDFSRESAAVARLTDHGTDKIRSSTQI